MMPGDLTTQKENNNNVNCDKSIDNKYTDQLEEYKFNLVWLLY